MIDKKRQAAQEYEMHWNAMVPSYEARQRLRDQIYGFRIEDDPHPEHGGSFIAICPEHGILGDDLTVMQARTLRDEHQDTHSAP